jgi:hypothetical protein
MHGPTFIFWASLTPVLSCCSGAEVNFWVPLTRVFGTNTLFVESAPGRGDFRPVELGYGACCGGAVFTEPCIFTIDNP